MVNVLIIVKRCILIIFTTINTGTAYLREQGQFFQYTEANMGVVFQKENNCNWCIDYIKIMDSYRGWGSQRSYIYIHIYYSMCYFEK